MRERGLKLWLLAVLLSLFVAPHAGAWIEIRTTYRVRGLRPRRSPCGSVD